MKSGVKLDAESAAILRQCRCAGCGTALYLVDDEGRPSTAVAYAAHVISRRRTLPSTQPRKSVVWPSGGREVIVQEIPQVCSRACLKKVVWKFDAHPNTGPAPREGGNLQRCGDEWLVRLWGDTIPENPSSENPS